ncbi:hypothetical protein GCM10010210_12920 [Pseudonocardia hydrocarbonoxydans]|uniref:Uncharacterized protein n=1 Tax=Pseudonocardia hydrocarbonoxydans TaxID=76726 RepID=A0A4Y3WTA0_9PSEU|nr:hypothetical protein PHY01_32620 [Pseudonocardia hydrocarbonoxydans]
MTVADLEGRMSNREFVEWAMFYARRNQRRELAEKRHGRR